MTVGSDVGDGPDGADGGRLPDEAFLCALAAVPGMGPARLGRILDGRPPQLAWAELARAPDREARRCGAPAAASSWARAVPDIDIDVLWRRHLDAGVGVLGWESPAFPDELRADADPPVVLFSTGDPVAHVPTRVGVVGTRRCTRYGVDIARELGAMLSACGVSVVSGLAAGIDAAAHAGALDAGGAPPVAVAGTPLDCPYPARNRALWSAVGEQGVIFSEAPLGAPIERWRFPARNRIIAALSHALVVVESHERGGSLYTAAQAIDRDRPVFAVPGPVRSPASLGCNRLLLDGCLPLCELDDVMVALGMAAPEPVRPAPPAVELAEVAWELIDAIGWRPTSFATLAERLEVGPDRLAAEVERLVSLGVLGRRGPWIERTPVPVGRVQPGRDAVSDVGEGEAP